MRLETFRCSSTIILHRMTDRGRGWDVRGLLGVLEAVVARRCHDLRKPFSLQTARVLFGVLFDNEHPVIRPGLQGG